jgi:hypothetical protein
MAITFLNILTLLSRAATSVLTNPTAGLLLLGWFAVSKFDLGVAANQLQRSITELWWLVSLILLTAICNTTIKAYFQARRHGDK